jgi:hypothetical protein
MIESYQAPALIYLIFDRHHQRLLEYSEILPKSPQTFFNLLHGMHPMSSGVYEYKTLEPHNYHHCGRTFQRMFYGPP